MVRLQHWFYKYNAWSFTRHRLWKDCKLAYYFSYIGTALTASSTININQLKKLKKLDSRFVIQGKLIHDVIEKQIHNYHQKIKVNEREAENQYISGLENYRKNAQFSLIEYVNGESVKQSFFDRIREDGLDQLSLFFGAIWPELEGQKYLRHEEFDRFMIDDIPVIVKVDYASKDNDSVIMISDWKTGIDNEEYENDLQVAAYVLWATKFYKVPANQVSSELVYLTTGRRARFSFSTQQLNDLVEIVTTDYKDMNRSYEIEHFEANPSPRNCISCPFASVCSHSQAKQFLE